MNPTWVDIVNLKSNTDVAKDATVSLNQDLGRVQRLMLQFERDAGIRYPQTSKLSTYVWCDDETGFQVWATASNADSARHKIMRNLKRVEALKRQQNYLSNELYELEKKDRNNDLIKQMLDKFEDIVGSIGTSIEQEGNMFYMCDGTVVDLHKIETLLKQEPHVQAMVSVGYISIN